MLWFKKKKEELIPADFVWLKDLYLGDSVRARADQLREDIILGKIMEGAEVILLSTNPKNQLDLISIRELVHPYYRKRQLKIVGLTGGREESHRILLEMMNECLRKTGTADLRGYLEQRLGEEEDK